METAHPIQFPASKYLPDSWIPDFENWAVSHGSEDDRAMVKYVDWLRGYEPVEWVDYFISGPAESEVYETVLKAMSVLKQRNL